jgi:hypothetical protein
MIQKTAAFQTSDGKTFADISEAQRHEIGLILPLGIQSRSSLENAVASLPMISRDEAIDCIVENAVKIVDILTTTESSRVRSRKANGGTRKRKQQPAPTPEHSNADK